MNVLLAIGIEAQREKTFLLPCAPNEDSNQPAHLHSLTRVVAVPMKKFCILGYPKCASIENSFKTVRIRGLIRILLGAHVSRCVFWPLRLHFRFSLCFLMTYFICHFPLCGFGESGFDFHWSLYLSAQKRRPWVYISTPLRYQQKVVRLVLDPRFKSSYEPLRKLS